MRFTLLDGLRGVAAIAVVILHSISPLDLEKNYIPHAHLAVYFFFALSGFVIAHAYESRIQKIGPAKFMVLRLIRLYPLLFVGITLGLLVSLAKSLAGRQMRHSAHNSAPT